MRRSEVQLILRLHMAEKDFLDMENSYFRVLALSLPLPSCIPCFESQKQKRLNYKKCIRREAESVSLCTTLKMNLSQTSVELIV